MTGEYLDRMIPGGIDSLHTVARFGSSTAVKEGIKAGVGISILSVRAIETELAAGVLKSVKVKGIDMSRSFYVIRDRRRIASPACRAMLDFLIDASVNERKECVKS